MMEVGHRLVQLSWLSAGLLEHLPLLSCDNLTVLFDQAFVAFKCFTVIGDFDIAHAAITYHVVHICATYRFFPHLICIFTVTVP